MTSRFPALCDSCANLRVNGSSCPAYPDLIPEDIRVWAGNHHKKRSDQTGDTVWEFKPGKQAELDAWEALN